MPFFPVAHGNRLPHFILPSQPPGCASMQHPFSARLPVARPIFRGWQPATCPYQPCGAAPSRTGRDVLCASLESFIPAPAAASKFPPLPAAPPPANFQCSVLTRCAHPSGSLQSSVSLRSAQFPVYNPHALPQTRTPQRSTKRSFLHPTKNPWEAFTP